MTTIIDRSTIEAMTDEDGDWRDAVQDVQEALTSTYPELNPETVVFHWTRDHGDCYECPAPAAFYILTPYNEIQTQHKRCAVCAANSAADGEEIRWIANPYEMEAV